MKYMLYIPDAKLMFVYHCETPGYILNKIRRNCYKYLRWGRCRNDFIVQTVTDHGGLSNTRFIMSDSIPFCMTYDTFISYNGDKFVESWLDSHPGRRISPIVDDEEYNDATVGRHDLDNAPDMYPTGS